MVLINMTQGGQWMVGAGLLGELQRKTKRKCHKDICLC